MSHPQLFDALLLIFLAKDAMLGEYCEYFRVPYEISPQVNGTGESLALG
jgi:hypothetical protein